jgi:small subunit ribosomal protein S9
MPVKKTSKKTKTVKTTKKDLSKKSTKTKVEKKVAPKATKNASASVASKQKYVEALGRRKRSVARVRFYKDKQEKGRFIINKKQVNDYFPEIKHQATINDPLEKTSNTMLALGKIEIIVRGGGRTGQAEAIRLGISRLILKGDEKTKTILKTHGFLTRDPRKKERKKFGLKKARKAPQFSKR